uniref:Protein SYS1 homolog n=1 Tax=Phallusia mammillata TaxID=59560 RepID=A0A6F9DTK0_9ASCI|nr:protein SYS1 homolog [Phallusia mammillata]
MDLFCQVKTSTMSFLSRLCPQLLYQKLSTNNPMSNMTGRFRSYVWDPALIIFQMLAMQCVYYTTLGLLSTLLLSFGKFPPSLHYLFDTGAVHYYGAENRLVLVAHLLNSIFGAVALWYIVQRAKQCLDFSCTLHFFHFVVCWIYSGYFPTRISWWLVQLVCIVLMVVIGEYLCFQSDMKDIPLIGNKADV